MNKSLHELSKLYTSALQNYLTTEGEEALHLAYNLGRKAIGEGLGILDVARIHQQASVAAMLPTMPLAQNERQLRAVEDFFMEALSPFEAHQRGFRQANIALRELTRNWNVALPSWPPPTANSAMKSVGAGRPRRCGNATSPSSTPRASSSH